MTNVLFDTNHITLDEIQENRSLIENILLGSLRYPKVKKLSNMNYQGEAIYRAKIDEKNRLIYTYVPHKGQRTLLILAVNNHNYNKIERQFIEPNNKYEELPEFDEKATSSETSVRHDASLSFHPAVSYKQMTLVLGESQQKALEGDAPLLLVGPPGSGKTVVLYNIMLRALQKPPQEDAVTFPALFISQSETLISTLRELYHATPRDEAATPIKFVTWNQLLQDHYPQRKAVTKEKFAQWFKEQKLAAQRPSDQVHYELSLIASLGKESYLKELAGRRQCYFSDDASKKELLQIATQWQHYLADKLFDPMVTLLNPEHPERYSSVFCDEAQNLPPIAFVDLTERVDEQRFVACLDSEQCLLSSPFIQNFLKQLLHQRYIRYNEKFLPTTWRCPPQVIETANTLINWKYKTDTKGKRREYQEVKSTHTKDGLVSWINEKGFASIKHYGTSAGTVVIAENLGEGERQRIEDSLGTSYILTPREAIGLDFDVVILWNPFSLKKCLHTLVNTGKHELSLEQENALNAIYVSLTRAKSTVFLCELQEHCQKTLGEPLFGSLPQNETSPHMLKDSEEEKKQAWEQSVEHHLKEKNFSVAREIMSFHLQMSDEKIEARIAPVTLAPDSTTPPTKNTMPAKPKKKQKKAVASQQITEPASTSKVVEQKTVAKQKNPGNPKNQVNPAETNTNTPAHTNVPSDVAPLVSLNKQDTYIINLFRTLGTGDLTQEGQYNLTNLFKHKNAAKILFQKIKPDNIYVFTTLMLNYHWRGWVLATANTYMESLSQDFTAEYLCSPCVEHLNITPLFLLAKEEEGRKIIKKALVLNKQLGLGISAKDLTLTSTTEIGENALYWLLVNPQGLEIFNMLLTINPELALEIKAKDLARALPASAGINENISPLYWLSIYVDGRRTLKRLLTINPELALEISAKDLARALPAAAGISANASPLYGLSCNNDGWEILKILFTANHQLALEIRAKDLARALPASAGINANLSPLYWLSYFPGGNEILKILLTANPKLACELSAKDLTLALPAAAEGKANTSPLYWLAVCPGGREILNILLMANPRLALEIRVKDLTLALPAEAGENANTSPLYGLSGCHDGWEILKILFAANPQLACEISAEDLARALPVEAGVKENTSALYWLLVFPEGRELFEILLKTNKNLAAEITAEHLTLTRPDTAGVYANTSPLYWLSGGVDGQKIFQILLKANEKLASEIRVEHLTLLLPAATGAGTNISALYWLSGSPAGQEIIKALLEANEELASKISADHLILKRPAAAGADANTSVLYWLFIHREGKEILNILFRKNPHLLSELTQKISKEIRAFRNEVQTTAANFFHWLIGTDKGVYFLSGLLDISPIIANEINATDLSCTPLCDNDGKLLPESPLFMIASKEYGIPFLKKLFEKNLEIAKEIAKNNLLQTQSSLQENNKTTYTLLALLASGNSEVSHKMLLNLLNLNPQIYAQIKIEHLSFYCETNDGNKRHYLWPLFFLSKSSCGVRFLDKLLNSNSNLVSKISGQIICECIGLEIYPADYKKSILYHLASRQEGQLTLNLLLKLNPGIMKEIKAELLKIAIPSDKGTDDNITLESVIKRVFDAESEACNYLSSMIKTNPINNIMESEQERPASNGKVSQMGMFAPLVQNPGSLGDMSKTQIFN